MAQINPSLPILLQPDSSEDPKIVTALTQLIATINALDSANIVDGTLVDTDLASPTNAVWRTVAVAQAGIGSTLLTTTPFYFTAGGASAPSGNSTTTAVQGLWIPPAAADIAVAGKTTRLRLRVAWMTNATGPGITLTWGLYPVASVAGGASAIAPTLGTVVAGSTAAVAPGASTANHVESASFDASAVTVGNPYVIGVVGSSTQAASSLVSSAAILEMRHT